MIKGSIVNLTTPTHSDGSPDYEVQETLVDWHVDCGSSAIIIGSALNQSSEMSIDERTEILRRAIWQSDGRIDVIADLSSSRQEAVFDFASAADEFGASAALLTLPSPIGLSQNELFEYLRAVLELGGLPLIISDDLRASNSLPSIDVAALSQISGIAGFINYSANPIEGHIPELPSGFALYSGDVASGCHRVLNGYAGIVSVVANIAPALVHSLYSAAASGDQKKAELLNARLLPLVQVILEEPNALPIKWALIEMGSIPEGNHPPSLLHTSDYADLRRALRAALIPI